MLWRDANIASLVWFRILFGLLMVFSVLRFAYFGWIKELYIDPQFYFAYYGFEWVEPLSGNGMYWLFGIMGLSALFVALGLFYRCAAALFFLSFTYVELIDKTNYLNHYYFISLIAFILIWLPAHRSHSLDVRFKIAKPLSKVPNWTINLLKFQIGVVYFFAGVAKLNYHWLFEAQPLSNWLKHQSDLPVIGSLMGENWVAYLFAWAGCLFDLSVVFLLSMRKTRIYAYLAVVFFHTITGIMFPIGVFPWVMIVLTTVFFEPNLHSKLLIPFTRKSHSPSSSVYQPKLFVSSLILFYVTVQLLLPFRYLLYPGKLFWTEQGYRFSWRVMLIEKVGYCTFYLYPENGDSFKVIESSSLLTEQQIKQMSTQPDMILQFAHYLRDIYKDEVVSTGEEQINLGTPRVYVDAKVVLFNTGSRTFIDPTVDLAAEPFNLAPRKWIMPYEN